MPPSLAATCGQCQRSWIHVLPKNLPPLFARSRTVPRAKHQARSPRNRLPAVSLHARLPSKDPQTAARTRNQQVDEQALFSLKKLGFQSADDLRRSKGSGPFRLLKFYNNGLYADSTRRIRRSDGFGHRFQHAAEIAVGREDRGRVLLKSGAHHIEAAQKRIEFLLIRRAKSCGVNPRGFGVGFAFNLKRVFSGIRTDRGDVAFFLTVDVRRFATPLGPES